MHVQVQRTQLLYLPKTKPFCAQLIPLTFLIAITCRR